jgi:hypothetical protein
MAGLKEMPTRAIEEKDSMGDFITDKIELCTRDKVINILEYENVTVKLVFTKTIKGWESTRTETKKV